MYKNRQAKCLLGILATIMVVLSFSCIAFKYKFDGFKNNKITNNVKENIKVKNVEKFGYSDILECLNKNKNFKVESINMTESEKCNVEVTYKGDIKLLYSSLVELNRSKNILNISTIIIHKETKATNIGINFIKNK